MREMISELARQLKYQKAIIDALVPVPEVHAIEQCLEWYFFSPFSLAFYCLRMTLTRPVCTGTRSSMTGCWSAPWCRPSSASSS
jgi:hypothetical protein